MIDPMTDRRRFLKLLASPCAVAACPKIVLPPEATVEPVQMVATAAPWPQPAYMDKAEFIASVSRACDDPWED